MRQKCSICGSSEGELHTSGPGLHRFHTNCTNGALNYVWLLNDVNSDRLPETQWFTRPFFWPSAPERAVGHDKDRIRGQFRGEVYYRRDQALLLRFMTAGKVRWEPFTPDDGRGELCFHGLRHSTRLGDDGCPLLTDNLRVALGSTIVAAAAKGTPLIPADATAQSA